MSANATLTLGCCSRCRHHVNSLRGTQMVQLNLYGNSLRLPTLIIAAFLYIVLFCFLSRILFQPICVFPKRDGQYDTLYSLRSYSLILTRAAKSKNFRRLLLTIWEYRLRRLPRLRLWLWLHFCSSWTNMLSSILHRARAIQHPFVGMPNSCNVFSQPCLTDGSLENGWHDGDWISLTERRVDDRGYHQ